MNSPFAKNRLICAGAGNGALTAEGIPVSTSTSQQGQAELDSDTECRSEGSSGLLLTDELMDLEALMDKMSKARGRLGTLPDDIRRSEAESLTLELMAKIGLAEDSPSESDSA